MMSEPLWVTSRSTAVRLHPVDAVRVGKTHKTAGANIAAVVLHGLVTGVDVLRAARPRLDPYARLAAEGVHVLGVDWPGHGRSGGARGHLTYRAAMDAAAAAVGVAAQRWNVPVALVGSALGGVLAFYAALEDERVVAVACHNVLDLRDVRPVLQRTRQKVLLPLAGQLLRRLDEGSQRHIRLPSAAIVAPGDLANAPELSHALRHHPQAVRSYTLAGLGSILLTPADKPDVAAQTTPTLIALGSSDRVLPVAPTHEFVSRLTCPHELWLLPGGGHQLLLEHPDAAIPKIAGFLREHA